MKIIKVTVAKCGTNYAASLSDDVPGAVVLTADTYEELQQKAPEVLKFHVNGMIANGAMFQIGCATAIINLNIICYQRRTDYDRQRKNKGVFGRNGRC